MVPANNKIIQTVLERALHLIALLILIALPCVAQTHKSTAKNAHTAPPCDGSQLSLNRDSEDGATGGKGVYYSFQNTSSSPCTLRGYPVFVLLDDAEHQIPRIRIKHRVGRASNVTLAPRGKAFFYIYYRSCEFARGAEPGHSKPCMFSAKVRIDAPGTKRAFVLPEPIDPDERVVEVSQVSRQSENPSSGA